MRERWVLLDPQKIQNKFAYNGDILANYLSQ